jgi:DNA polymerase III subunit beta
MRVSVLSENLSKAVGIAVRSVSGKAQLPVLTNLLVRAKKTGLEVMGTDLELSLVVKVGAKVEEEGEILVPARLLNELVATLPLGTVDLSLQKQVLMVVSGKMKAELVGLSADEYPVIPRYEGKGIKIKAGLLRETLSRVAVSAARENTRPVLEGVWWSIEKDGVELAATDGYRLGTDKLKVEVGSGQNQELVVPVRAVAELSRLIQDGQEEVVVEFDKDKQQVIFGVGEVELISRLIGGDFPPFKQIIPQGYKTKIKMPREELLAAVKRASVFARGNANIVIWQIEEERLVVSAASAEVGKNESEIEIQGEVEKMKIAFNGKYLIDYLGVLDVSEVTFESEGELRPGVFRIEKSDFVQVVMPIRQND